MAKDDGRDVFDTALDNPYIMSGVGATLGAVAGRGLARLSSRRKLRAEQRAVDRYNNEDDAFDAWKDDFRARHGRKPNGGEQNRWRKRYQAEHEDDVRESWRARDASNEAWRTAPKVGAAIGGGAGFGYSQGRKKDRR